MRGARNVQPTPGRIVVRGVNWVGDTIMTIPAMRALRRIFPSAHIAFWVPSGLESLLQLTRIPDEIISFDKDQGGAFKRSFLMKRGLEQGHFDLAVLFQNAFESAFTAWIAGIKLREGFSTDLRGPFLNIKVPFNPTVLKRHQVYCYLEIVKHLDNFFKLGRYSHLSEPNCSIGLSQQQLEVARKLLVSEGIDLQIPKVCLCPGSVNSEAKRWPAEYFAELADIIIQDSRSQIIFLGSVEEKELINEIIGQMKEGQAFNLASKSNLVSSLGIMNLSDLVISNDTGSAHLAAAAATKVVTIFGPTVARETAPFGKNTFIIQGKASCAPCREHQCRTPGHPCMRNLTPLMVAGKALEVMALPYEEK
ncbi:MAG: lipopolysaccharide heptosyltransferase II [Pseudomonadota bacterium]